MAGRLLPPGVRGTLSCLGRWSSWSRTPRPLCLLGCFIINGSFVLFC